MELISNRALKTGDNYAHGRRAGWKRAFGSRRISDLKRLRTSGRIFATSEVAEFIFECPKPPFPLATQHALNTLDSTQFLDFPSPTMIAGLVCAGAGVYGAYWIQRFAKADADLTLLGLKPPKEGFYEDKVVWITGASQGLGKALAEYFSEQGARLIISSRREEQLRVVAAGCKGKHAKSIQVLPFDLTATPGTLKEVAQKALSAFNGAGPDYIIHNAGASQHSLAPETKPSVVQDIFHLNTIGPIALTQALIPGLLEKNKGHFVVVASMGAKVPSPGQALYSGCKYGLLGYFESLRTELADSPIGVTVCCPGPTATAGTDATRVVYGPDGLIKENQTGHSGSRQTIERVVELIATAAAHELIECWIAKQPILLIGYLMQYFPSIGWWFLSRYGPARAKQIKTGNAYSIRKILLGKKD